MKRRLNRTVVAGLALSAALTAASASPLAAAAPEVSAISAPPSAAARAAQSAQNHVASRPAALHSSADDRFIAHPAISGGNSQYVPHERTYKGLPVVGGDFVVVTDNSGRVVYTSVAQQHAIGNIAVKPQLSAQSAQSAAGKTLSRVDTVAQPSLVVYALGDAAPRLAWETSISGFDGHEDVSRSVYVDAIDARILGTRERSARGTGTGAYNGPNPLQLDTTLSGSTYQLKDPNHPTLVCQDYANNTTFSKATDTWGNGDAASKETGCVDAMFAAQTQWKMLDQWLGRNGPDGSGGTWPMRVGWNAVNAEYTGTYTRYGNNGNSPSHWITSMDVVAHEIGHGIDDHTPGGISGSGTQEFIGDAFANATEFFSNQPSPHDVPDYSIGEEINLSGGGPIRWGHKPSLESGHPDCYSSSVPTMEVHAAAGPGNHWFYLLAEGTSPTNGQPASATCNGTTLTGVGIQNAIKVLYNAMLMKTSSSSYLKYRTWTLTAAKNLDATCGLFNKTKAAWDAVSVPAQTGDPTCSGSGTVTVTNPGSQTGTVGVAATLNMSASGGTPPYTWSATGLPAGLSINSSSGQISGTPTTAGTSNVTVTASGGSTSFTWTINPVSTPGCSGTNASDVAITDNATVSSSIAISGCTGNASATSTVEVHIVHTYIGDLKVDLIAPDGTVYVLHNRTGSGTDNINQTYTVNVSSEVANGTWKLQVNDNAGGDVGKIDTWTLNLGGGTTPGCTGSNANDVTITDNATVSSSIAISGCTGNASSTSTVEVHIVHTYIGDLKVDLVAPDGTVYVLHNRTGSGTDNINQTYTVNVSSEVRNGTWKLQVNDNAANDVGKIDSWTLTL